MEDVKPVIVPEADDVIMHHTYPSPSADAHFYHLASQRDQDMEHDADPDQLVQQALANLAEHQEQQNQEHENDLRELRALQDPQPDESQHHQVHQAHGQHAEYQEHHPPVSVDELRLAAQLTQEITPMIASAAQNHTHNEPLPHQDTQAQGTQDQSQVHPDLQQQLQAELQNHERELQNILPPEEQSAEPHFEPTNPSPTSNIPPMAIETYHTSYQLADNIPPRKRSKVSRACDECRRKKIKCDAQADIADQPCSNCKRSSSQCLFSRVPQKRGPSKGYIKELADRIHTIEGKLGANVVDVLESAAKRASVDSFPSPQSVEESRKRPFSSISGDGFPTPSPASARGIVFPTDPKLIQIRPSIQSNTQPYSVNNLAPKPLTPSVLPDGSPIPPRPEPEFLDAVPDGLPSDPLQSVEQAREIDDSMFDCYITAIHPTFPVLSRTKARTQSLLSQCPIPLQDTFCSAFSDLTRPFTHHISQANNHEPALTEDLLTQWELGRRRWRWTPAVEVVYFQTLVMMVLDSGHRGITESSRQSRDAWKSGALGKAVGVGLSMKLHLATPDSRASPDLDPDSDDNVALRAWWTLVTFDRWNAIATGEPLFVSLDTAVLLQGIRYIVGEEGYYLISLSDIIGSFVPAVEGSRNDWGPAGTRLLSNLTSAITRGIRRDFFDKLDEDHYPLLHLAYWHTCLLSHLLSPEARLPAIPNTCIQIFRLLSKNPQLVSPLKHHFVSLASLVVTELAKVDETRDEALKIIESFLAAPANAAVREKIAETTRTPAKNGLGVTNDVKNLQQLADVATAVDSALAPASVPAANQGGLPPPPPPPTSIPALMSGGSEGVEENSPVAAASAAVAAAIAATTLGPVVSPVPVPPSVTDPTENHVDNTRRYAFNPHRFLKVGYLTFLEQAEKAVTG